MSLERLRSDEVIVFVSFGSARSFLREYGHVSLWWTSPVGNCCHFSKDTVLGLRKASSDRTLCEITVVPEGYGPERR